MYLDLIIHPYQNCNPFILYYIFSNNEYIFLSAAAPSGDAYRDILIDGFVPPSTSVAPMFPFYENSSEWDDFGEVINPDDYVIKEEDMDNASMAVSHFQFKILVNTLLLLLIFL